MTEQKTVIHRLTNRDENTLTAECSVCGLVAIRKVGNGFQCAVKKAEAHRAWAKKNPEKAAANRRATSDHELSGHDYVKETATCSLCGPVGIKAWGRGYACATLATSRRSVQEETPSRPCPDCWALDRKRVWLPADGVCARCANAEYDDVVAERNRDHMLADLDLIGAEIGEEPYGAGFSFFHIDSAPLPDDMPHRESAVPGWRTLGSSRPWNEVN